ncbi:UNVERIFIED_CONTAM: hypothetical protein NCL1_21366 [Trichonephila clavipes]
MVMLMFLRSISIRDSIIHETEKSTAENLMDLTFVIHIDAGMDIFRLLVSSVLNAPLILNHLQILL